MLTLQPLYGFTHRPLPGPYGTGPLAHLRELRFAKELDQPRFAG